MKRFFITTLILFSYLTIGEVMLTLADVKKTTTDFEQLVSRSFNDEQWKYAQQFIKDMKKAGQRSYNVKGTLHYLQKPFKSESYNANSLGFRGKEVTPKEEDEIRVMLVGASVIWGMYVYDNQTIPALLQKKLRAKYHKKITVYNLGFEATLLQNLISVSQALEPKIEPDLIIFYTGISDLYYSYLFSYLDWLPYTDNGPFKNPFFEKKHNNQSTIERILRKTRLGNMILRESSSSKLFGKNQFTQKRPDKETAARFSRHSDSFVKGFLKDVYEVKRYYDKKDIQTIMIFDNMLSTKKNKTKLEKQHMKAFESTLPFFELYTQICLMKLFSKKESDIFYQTQHIFDTVEGEIYWDGLHVNPRGHKIITDTIFNILTSLEDSPFDKKTEREYRKEKYEIHN